MVKRVLCRLVGGHVWVWFPGRWQCTACAATKRRERLVSLERTDNPRRSFVFAEGSFIGNLYAIPGSDGGFYFMAAMRRDAPERLNRLYRTLDDFVADVQRSDTETLARLGAYPR